MSNFFSRLFSTQTPPTDGLSQPQREAIVDLLHFCMCADHRLLPVESEAIVQEVTTFSWEPTIKFDLFAARSLERAKAAVSSQETRRVALDDIASRLATTENKTRAVTLCPHVFLADGEFAAAERAVFVEIKRAFGWPI